MLQFIESPDGNHNSLIASTNKAPALFHFNFVIKIVIILLIKISFYPILHQFDKERNAIPLGDKSLTVFQWQFYY